MKVVQVVLSVLIQVISVHQTATFQMIELGSQILSSIANMKTMLGIGFSGVALSGMGFVPKIGFGRSIVLGLKPLLYSISTVSSRKDEIGILTKKFKNLTAEKYILVTGAKGIGKSCLIRTALHRHFGVVFINVSPKLFYEIKYYKYII